MPPKRRKSQVSALVETRKKKPKIESNDLNPRTVIFADLEILGSLMKIFNCPGCKQNDCLTICFTTNELLNFHLKIKCTLCTFTYSLWALEKNFNSVFIAAKTCAGVTSSQIRV